MRRFVHEAVSIILQRFVLSIVEHWQSLNCCEFLITIILVDSRVLLKLLSFFIRKCVTHHSCQFVEYCSWNVFRQQFCHVLQSTQLVERDETDLVQLLNPLVCISKCFALLPAPSRCMMALALLLSVQSSILNGRAVWCSSRCFNTTLQCNFLSSLWLLIRLRIAILLLVSQTNVEL